MPQPEDVPPLVAILRGVRPDEILGIATVLESAGIGAIEVPLNSPDPLESIARLCREFGDRCLCGAGTVLSVAEVDAVHAAGGRLIVTPNTDPAVIGRAVTLNLTVIPGFGTATEALRAIQAGARALKLFPAATHGPGHLKAIRDVLPKSVRVLAVGGVGAANLAPWIEAGAAGIGVGGELYRAGDSPADVGRRAHGLVGAWRAAVAARAGTHKT